MLTEKTTITLTKDHKTKAKDSSVRVFGKENLSGYIQYLITKDYEERERRQK